MKSDTFLSVVMTVQALADESGWGGVPTWIAMTLQHTTWLPTNTINQRLHHTVMSWSRRSIGVQVMRRGDWGVDQDVGGHVIWMRICIYTWIACKWAPSHFSHLWLRGPRIKRMCTTCTLAARGRKPERGREGESGPADAMPNCYLMVKGGEKDAAPTGPLLLTTSRETTLFSSRILGGLLATT